MEQNFERFELFKKMTNDMIATSEMSYNERYGKTTMPLRAYTKEEIEKIISGGSLEEQQMLSRQFFERDGFYKRITLYYASLLKYMGILVPKSINGQSLSSNTTQKKYYNAMNYIDKMKLKELLFNWTLRVLVDGAYYGIVQTVNKNIFSIIDLPTRWCRTRFKDEYGRDIIEFNVLYFNTIINEKDRESCFKIYPKIFKRYYDNLKKNKVDTPWMFVPIDISICFTFLESNRPLFLHILPAVLDYDDTVEMEKVEQEDRVKKIIVQKVPHLNDGTLLFEPEEAQVMHRGAVQMLRGNKYLNVLTTYTDVDAIVSKTTADSVNNNNIEKMITNIYNETGVSGELFASTSNLALKYSLSNDTSLMMILANRYSSFLTTIINNLYGNNSIIFKYTILPITYYNEQDYLDESFKLASSGYSLLLPALSIGIDQSDLIGLKDLENNILKLNEKLKPLSSSYTQSSDAQKEEAGAPEKALEDKSDKTEKNIEAIEQGGVVESE